MGLKYSSTDSQNLISAMRNNVELANQVTDRLSSGCEHLISALDSGELTGAAYTAGKGLFTEVIIPSIMKLQEAIDDIQAELTSYEYADSTVSEYGTLDLDNMEQQLEAKISMLSKIEDQLALNAKFLSKASALFSGNLDKLIEQNTLLRNAQTNLQVGIDGLNERIEKLKWFDSDVSTYFSDSLAVLQLAIEGASALGNITLDEAGHYYTNGTNMDWLAEINETEIETTDRGTDPQLSLIKQNARELMLTDGASVYYRQQLTEILDGKPASDWPMIIDAYNKSLLYDDDGNILSVLPFNAGSGDGFIVLKNGEYDESYTKQINIEQNSQSWESLGENAMQILYGLSEILGGGMIGLTSASIGAGGYVLALPTGGTITIPATAVASAGMATSATLVSDGTVVLMDALSKVAVANSNLNISFAKSHDEWKPPRKTSNTFGKPIEGRVNGRKSQIRVDAEPDSNSVHIQTGGGKTSPLKRKIDLSKVSDKNSIYRVLKDMNIPEVRSLSKGKLDSLVHNIWRAIQSLRSLNQ